MKKFYVLAAIITVLYMMRGYLIEQTHPSRDTIETEIDIATYAEKIPEVSKEKQAVYLSVEDEIIICLAYVEDFRTISYFCGARWTIGYGSTYYANGRRVQSGESITMLEAQKTARSHLRKNVFPYIDRYIKRELSREEIIGTSLFIYNVGCGNFIKSSFLQAVNEGKPPEESARRMTEFTRSGGRYAEGLLKREWVQGALYCGYLTPYDLLNFSPGGLYNFRVGELYKSISRSWDGFYNYDYSERQIQNFKRKSKTQGRKVLDII